jgi:hypothetical protein
MKNLTQIKWIVLLVFSIANAQEKGIIGSSNWLSNWTDFKPAKIEYKETNQILFGKIDKDYTLFKKNTYLLQGSVYVTNGAKLTIEPGTVIRGDYDSNGSLVITKGASIIANGTETDPIVFTSNRPVKKPGDWCGVVIIGDAPINKFGGTSALAYDLDPSQTIYGGTNPQGNSGVMRFVRIEFAGKKIKGFKEFNSLTIAGVGNKTVIENVMSSFSGKDAFGIYGGDVNLTKLVAFRSGENDFKFTQGAQAHLDNSLVVRHSYYSSSSRSRCLEVLAYDKKEETDFSKGLTNVTATNITMINGSESLSADIASGLVKEAVFIANNASLALKRSVISGFNPAILFASDIDINDKNLSKIKIEQMFFNNCVGNIFVENSSNNEDLENYYGNRSFNNLLEKVTNGEAFIDITNARDPDYRIKIGKFTAGTSK